MHSTSADNEASNKMMDIEGFKGRFCKQCTISYSQLQKLYNGSLEDAINDRIIPDTHAFNSAEAFIYNLRYFYTFDAFHDFSSSGIILKVIRPMLYLYYIEKNNSFKRDLKAFEIKRLKLLKKLKALNHRNGMINGIDKDGFIHGTCSQVIDFFILFGYLDDDVDRNSEHFKLYLKIRNIFLFLTSDIIKKDKLKIVENEIKSFLSKYDQLYKANQMETIIPKMHHIEHYPDCIRVMGNPRLYQTQRYERKHQDIKRSESNSLQFKNKSYSIAKWELLTRKIEFKEIESILEDKSPLDLDNPVNRLIFDKFLDKNSNYVNLKQIKIKKIELKIGKLFRLKEETNNSTNFIKIIGLFQLGNNYLIVGSCLKSKFYIADKCCFKVEFENKIKLVDINKIFHSELIFIEEEMLILKDFSLDSDF